MVDGSQSIPIGANKVDNHFFNDVYFPELNKVNAAIDPVNKFVVFTYMSRDGADGGVADKALIYDWVNQKWSTAVFNSEVIFTTLSQAITMEGLDTLSASVDGLPFSLDSTVYMGGRLLLSGFDTDHKLTYFNSTALDATIETTEFQPIPGRRSLINSTRPIVSGTDATTTVAVATRNLQTGAASFDPAVSLNSTGDAPQRSDGRYHTVRCNITGGFDSAQGVEVNWKASGAR